MSTLKVDTVRPVTTDADLALQGDASGSGVTGAKVFGDGSLGADSITDLAGTGAPDFPYGATISGHIIRTTYSTVYTTSVSTSGSETATGLKITVNKNQSDSLIYLTFFANIRMDSENSDSTASLTIKNNTASSSIQSHSIRLATAYGTISSIRVIYNSPTPFFAVDSASTTGSREYELYFSINSGAVAMNGDAGYSQVIALEVLPNA